MKLTKQHFIAYIVMFSAIFGLKLTTSLFSVYLDKIGISLVNIGLIYALGGMAGGLLHFPIGELVDSYGRKGFIILSVICYPLFAIGVALAKSVYQFTALDMMVEFIGTVFWVAFMAHLFDILHKGREGKEISYSNIVVYSAAASAPFIAGFVAQVFGFTNLFYLSAIIGISAIPFALLMKEEFHIKRKFSLSHMRKKFVDVFHLYEFKLFFIIDLVLNFIWTLWVVYMPIYLEKQGFSTSIIGIIISANYISIALLQIPLGRWIDKYEKHASFIIIPGFFIMWMAGYAFIAAKKLITLIATRVALEIGSELTYDPIYPNVSRVAPKRMHGGGYALLTMGTTFVYSFASWIGGYLSDKLGIPFVFKLASVISLCTAVVLIFVKWHKTRHKLTYSAYLQKIRRRVK